MCVCVPCAQATRIWNRYTLVSKDFLLTDFTCNCSLEELITTFAFCKVCHFVLYCIWNWLIHDVQQLQPDFCAVTKLHALHQVTRRWQRWYCGMQEVVTLVKGRKHWMLYPHASMASFLNKYSCISKQKVKIKNPRLLEKKLATCTYKKFGLKCFQKLQTLYYYLKHVNLQLLNHFVLWSCTLYDVIW